MSVIPTRAWTGRSWFTLLCWVVALGITVLVLLAWLWPTIPLSRELREWFLRIIPSVRARL